jgi:hypothetical protein
MPIKVELHPEVYLYLERLPPAERDDFLATLEEVRKQPIGKSELHIETAIRGHVVRRFEFGVGARKKIAIFDYDAALGRMRVLKCRLRRPRKPTGGETPSSPGPTDPR